MRQTLVELANQSPKYNRNRTSTKKRIQSYIDQIKGTDSTNLHFDLNWSSLTNKLLHRRNHSPKGLSQTANIDQVQAMLELGCGNRLYQLHSLKCASSPEQYFP